MKKEVKIAAAVTAVTAAAAAATVGAVKVLVDMAVDKNIPKAFYPMRNKISGSVTGDEIMNVINEKCKLLTENTEIESVSIESRDGLRLTGHWYPAPNARRIVIAMHGWRSTWSFDFGVISEFLHNEGCSILLPDQRSQGESEGKHIGFGVLERYDCIDWLNYAIERLGTDLPFYLCGLSMGASTVLMASGLDLPDCVHGIICDCGFTSPHAIWSHVMNKNLHISDKLAYPIANFFINKKASFDGDAISTVDALAATKTPVLFIHGDDDHFVPVEMTYENYNACASPKRMLIVPGADHAMSYFIDTEAYEKYVRDFFSEYDKKQEI